MVKAYVAQNLFQGWLCPNFTNDLKRKEFFSKNVHSCRLSLFKGIIPVYIFYHYYPGLSYVENHMSIYFDKATLISP